MFAYPKAVQGYGPKSVQLQIGTRTSTAEVTVTVACVAATPPRGLLKIPVVANGFIYDPIAVMLYAAISKVSPANPNTIARIDAITGQALDTIPVGSDPATMALSDDGHFLWLGADGDVGAGIIQRIDLYTRSVDLQISLSQAFADQNLPANNGLHLAAIAAIPSQPHSIAVVASLLAGDNTQLPVAFFDDGIRRPNLGPVPDSFSVAFDQDPQTAWTLNKSITVNAVGAVATQNFYNIWGGDGGASGPIVALNGLLFSPGRLRHFSLRLALRVGCFGTVGWPISRCRPVNVRVALFVWVPGRIDGSRAS